MLKFDPQELLVKLRDAGQKFEEFCSLRYDWYPIHEPDFNPADYHNDGDDDEVINMNSIIEGCSFSSSDVCFDLTVAEFLEWADLLDGAKLIDRSECRLPNRTIVYVVPDSERAHSYVYGARCAELTPFSLILEKEGGCEDYCSSLSEEDHYVEVHHPPNTTPQLVSDIIDSYLFELSASFSIDFKRTRFPEACYGFEDLDVSPLMDGKGKLRIRTPDISNGLPELYRIYLRGVTASDVEHQIINLVKVIEFVSATTIRLATHDVVKQRLLSPDALIPDAKFLDDLITLIDDNRVYKNDSEALKFTIQACCDAAQLAHYAPSILTNLSSINEKSDLKTKKRSLADFSACLTSTRNQLVHAKANYTVIGNECPYDQLPTLAECVRLAAIQVIRWFSGLPAESRLF